MAHRILFTCSGLQAELSHQGDGAAVGDGRGDGRETISTSARTHLPLSRCVETKKKTFLKAHDAWLRRIQMISFKLFGFVVVAVFVVSTEKIWYLNSTRDIEN